MKGIKHIALLLISASVFSVLIFQSRASAESPSGDFVGNELIVKIKPGASLAALDGVLIGNRLSKERVIPELNLMLVRLPGGALIDVIQKRLSENPNFEFVEKNYARNALIVPNDSSYSLQYHHARIQSPQGWDIETGDSSAIIAVIDTGAQANHPDLAGKVLVGRNLVGSANDTNSDDGNGHGTGVSGMAAANTNNSLGIAGVCWGCAVLPVRVLANNGSGTLFDIIEGINFVANYAALNPDKRVVINLSLGGACGDGAAEQEAIDNAWNSGALIVAAAGNAGTNAPVCPAARNNVIAVSATNHNDAFTGFSSFGDFVDVSAPGAKVYTLWKKSAYKTISGTSFSSPIVAGIGGLIWSFDPGLTNAEVSQIIIDTADDLGPQGYDIKFGHGRVNAYSALQAAGILP